LFVFSPYSQNSIIKNLNFQFQTPSDEVTEAQLGTAMAERGMEKGIMPVNEALDKYLTTHLLDQADLLEHTDVQWWTPLMGTSKTFLPDSSFLRETTKVDYWDKRDMDVLFGNSNSMPAGVPDGSSAMVATSDGTEVPFGTAQAIPRFASAGTIGKDKQKLTTGDSQYLNTKAQADVMLKDTKSVTDMVKKMEAFMGRSTPTPYNVTFDMYGIASEFGGRNFRMDFLPGRWFNRTYFRCYEQTQTITPDTWTTSISAQMITANQFLQPPGKPIITPYLGKGNVVSDPKSAEFKGLPRWSELSNRLESIRIASHRGEHFSTGPLMGGKLIEELKNFTAPHLPTLTARWCSKYIGPNAPQWINDWVYGFYGAYYSPDGKLNVPKFPSIRAKEPWESGTPEELGERNWGRSIPCTSDGRLDHSPTGGRVTGAAGSGDNSYGAGPVSTVRALFDLTRIEGAQRGINIPKGLEVRIVRYHDYWLVYPMEFPIPGKEPQTFQLDISKLFSIFMEMTQPNKYK
jgi:hypothetical protein